MSLLLGLIRGIRIATSLCRLLFGTAKTSDTLLLTAILTTPSKILKRRGHIGQFCIHSLPTDVHPNHAFFTSWRDSQTTRATTKGSGTNRKTGRRPQRATSHDNHLYDELRIRTIQHSGWLRYSCCKRRVLYNSPQGEGLWTWSSVSGSSFSNGPSTTAC